MAANDYHFISNWRVRATADEVCEILSDAESLPHWWPALYQSVRELEPGDKHGVGKVYAVRAKAGLPYILSFDFRITESDRPHGYALTAWGDLDGEGRWTFLQDGEWCDIEYDWRVRADKPLLRLGSPLLKPLFSWNHGWSMTKDEESLVLELERRRAGTDEERAAIAAPPGLPSLPLAKVVAGVGAAVGVLAVWRLVRRRG